MQFCSFDGQTGSYSDNVVFVITTTVRFGITNLTVPDPWEPTKPIVSTC
jgi:hypothetical protein